jgi:translation elongation factor EF-1alpha
MADQEIGRVTHYFDKAMVALLKLSGDLKVGEVVKIVKGDEEFEMEVGSMQVNHEAISEGKSGEEVAIKVTSPTKEGALVYKVEK